jgi:hypothetical protein
MQTKLHSLIEASLNTASGFVLSWCMWIWLVAPLFGIQSDAKQSFWITTIFTVTSVIRSYIWRRAANHYQWGRHRIAPTLPRLLPPRSHG